MILLEYRDLRMFEECLVHVFVLSFVCRVE